MKRCFVLLLLFVCVASISAAPVPMDNTLPTVVRGGVGDTINDGVNKVSGKLRISKTAVVSISVGLAVLVLLLLLWFCGCMK